MDLLSYFRVLRRRWVLIFALVLIGGTLGAASTFLSGDATSSNGHYKAVNTLVFQNSNNNGNGSSSSSSSSSSGANPAFTNLTQVAVLATTGDVPAQVAKKLNMDPHQVTERITTETDSNANTLTVTAIDPNGKSAERLADTVGQQLIDTLNQKEQARYDKLNRAPIPPLDQPRGPDPGPGAAAG